MKLVNSGQFNQENFEFVNFPDFCGYATTVILHLKISILDSPPTLTICFQKDSPGNIFSASFVS